jgi:hypothetical protein
MLITNPMKTRIDLLPAAAIKACGLIMAHGATKYGTTGTWANQPLEYHLERLHRHLNAFQTGEELEGESGLHHLAHAAVRCLFMLHLRLTGELNDRNQEPK